jgi:hypothetical protein
MRRALSVGINEYRSAPLAGCVDDAIAIAELLGRNDDGSPNFDVRLMTAPKSRINRRDLREAITELFQDAADIALLYFSGHGTERNLDGYLVAQDSATYDEGVAMSEVLAIANRSKVAEIVMILDCCHSGALGNVPAIDNDQAVLREGVTILAASRADQAALESAGKGLFTALFSDALRGGAADVLGNVTVASAYAYVDETLGPWDQRPLFKSHVARLQPLRHVTPAIDVAILRRLPEWFDELHSELPLDPSYEPDAEPKNAEHEAIFAYLQKCRAAKLVEPVGEEHMYYAAVNSRSCRLTPLGRHYWEMANRGRL